jgi:hypothetical protein
MKEKLSKDGIMCVDNDCRGTGGTMKGSEWATWFIMALWGVGSYALSMDISQYIEKLNSYA